MIIKVNIDLSTYLKIKELTEKLENFDSTNDPYIALPNKRDTRIEDFSYGTVETEIWVRHGINDNPHKKELFMELIKIIKNCIY